MVCCFRADLACGMALDAVQMVAEETGGRKEIDIKRYAKTEKVSLCYLPVSVAPTVSVAMVVCRYLEGRLRSLRCFVVSCLTKTLPTRGCEGGACVCSCSDCWAVC